jgi:hypothetical protein
MSLPETNRPLLRPSTAHLSGRYHTRWGASRCVVVMQVQATRGLLGLMLVVTLLGAHRPLWVDGLKPTTHLRKWKWSLVSWCSGGPCFPQVDSLTPTFAGQRWRNQKTEHPMQTSCCQQRDHI